MSTVLQFQCLCVKGRCTDWYPYRMGYGLADSLCNDGVADSISRISFSDLM